jgi:hypothetical protein
VPQELDLNKSFKQWFYTDKYSAYGGSRAEYVTTSYDATMAEAAYKEGAAKIGRDLYQTLLDYATAMAGIEDTKYNSSQAFEMAAQNILVYVERVLKQSEKP